jgi:hypothetical protein
MAVNFPSNVANNYVYSYGNKTWQWQNTNGGFWRAVLGSSVSNLVLVGNVYANGVTGTTGQVLTSNGGGGVFWSGSQNARQFLVYGTSNNISTEVELFTASGSRIPLNTNTTVYYTVDFVARAKDSATQTYLYRAAIQLKGVAENISGSIYDIGQLYETIIVRDTGISSFLVDARVTSPGSLGIFATSAAGFNVSWTAQVNTTEVSF